MYFMRIIFLLIFTCAQTAHAQLQTDEFNILFNNHNNSPLGSVVYLPTFDSAGGERTLVKIALDIDASSTAVLDIKNLSSRGNFIKSMMTGGLGLTFPGMTISGTYSSEVLETALLPGEETSIVHKSPVSIYVETSSQEFLEMYQGDFPIAGAVNSHASFRIWFSLAQITNRHGSDTTGMVKLIYYWLPNPE